MAQGLLRRCYSKKRQEAKILFLGLDNAGKTTCIARLSKEDLSAVAPTRGFLIRSLIHNGFRLNIWDVGGHRSSRPYWVNYAREADALVYVVDSTDKARYKENGNELNRLLAEDKFKGAPLLIFANKQDVLKALPAYDVSAQP